LGGLFLVEEIAPGRSRDPIPERRERLLKENCLVEEQRDEFGRSRPGPEAKSLLWLILATLWTVLTSFVYQQLAYFFEGALFQYALSSADLRWVPTLIYGLSTAVPVGILFAVTQDRSAKRILQPWVWASLLPFFMLPARRVGITQAQGAMLAQMGGLLAYYLVFWIIQVRDADDTLRQAYRRPLWKSGHPWLGVAVGLLMGLPWAWAGALGSPLDTILGLLEGLLFGWVAVRVLFFAGLRWDLEHGEGTGSLSAWDVWGIAMGAVILTGGLSQTFIENFMAVALALMGALVFVLWWAGRGNALEQKLGNASLALGLAAAWPLVFVDPDELSPLISTGAGELRDWITRASWATLGLSALLLLVLWLAGRRRAPGWRMGWVAGGALVVLGLVYGLAGRPGFFGDQLFVVLKDQADVSQANRMADLASRRTFVYQTLVKQAEGAQAPLVATLSRWGIPFRSYYLVDGMEVNGGPVVRAWLAAQPGVDHVLDSPHLRPLPAPLPQAKGSSTAATQEIPWNVSMTGADRVWKEFGVKGSGVVVGQSDSGVQGDHPELEGSYRGRGGDQNYNWYDPWYGSSSPTDQGGHGTHTLGIVMGSHVGIAPGAQWIGCVNLARNLGNMGFYLDCMQFMLAPFPQGGDALKDGDPTRGADVLNNSWGCPPVEGCDASSMEPAVRALESAGVFVVVSAGNNGDLGCTTLTDPPATYPESFTVGAIDRSGQLAPFSSLGPVLLNGARLTKPDLVAPGVDVVSSFPGSTYAALSGTSMAGPHVVGTVALMWSANPALKGNVAETRQILESSAAAYQGTFQECEQDHGTPNDAVGYGIVDAYRAVSAALSVK
jgi:subtilisin family serine protease